MRALSDTIRLGMPHRKRIIRAGNDDEERGRMDEMLARAQVEHDRTRELVADAHRIQSDSTTIREQLRARKSQKP